MELRIEHNFFLTLANKDLIIESWIGMQRKKFAEWKSETW